MSWLAGLALAQIATGLVWLITRWRHLGPWNGREAVGLRVLSIEMFVNGLPHFVFAYSCMRLIYPLILLALIYYPVWIILMLRANMHRTPRKPCACGVILKQL